MKSQFLNQYAFSSTLIMNINSPEWILLSKFPTDKGETCIRLLIYSRVLHSLYLLNLDFNSMSISIHHLVSIQRMITKINEPIKEYICNLFINSIEISSIYVWKFLGMWTSIFYDQNTKLKEAEIIFIERIFFLPKVAELLIHKDKSMRLSSA